jgi:hypothetical protein
MTLTLFGEPVCQFAKREDQRRPGPVCLPGESTRFTGAGLSLLVLVDLVGCLAA